jgi:hypothetical protein
MRKVGQLVRQSQAKFRHSIFGLFGTLPTLGLALIFGSAHQTGISIAMGLLSAASAGWMMASFSAAGKRSAAARDAFRRAEQAAALASMQGGSVTPEQLATNLGIESARAEDVLRSLSATDQVRLDLGKDDLAFTRVDAGVPEEQATEDEGNASLVKKERSAV